ncbi:hypothetical protein [Arthrobacter sedimenti]|uniref:hypothetical protein n=1 Tax=Arthrobacter sedimenti TaxID=2694931 RepID=UPI001CDB853C|nr:hypothetical protein [Arthrobacter sedimenti]
MPNFSGPCQPSHPADHIVAGPSLRFVYDYQSRKHASKYIRTGAFLAGPAPVAGSAGEQHHHGPLPSTRANGAGGNRQKVFDPAAPADLRLSHVLRRHPERHN